MIFEDITMGSKGLQYTEQHLYGVSGQPQLPDIEQDEIYDCYLMSSMGALAAQQPDRIRDAIRYQPDSNNPDTGVFHVTLHHPIRGQVAVPVTQADVEDNIQRDGGGTADNKKGSPIWPSVIEAAFAKLHDPNPQNNDRKEAYDVIGSSDRGGSLHEAMFALTGDAGHNLRYTHSPKGSSAPPGNTGEPPPFDVPLKSSNVSKFDDADGAYAKISEALGTGKAVTLSTRNEKNNFNDGVMEHHAYIVTGVEQREKKDGTNEIFITMRNPYAHNNNTPSESKDTSKPSITVSLDKMLEKDVFGEINIGPAPRVQTQQQGTPAPEQSTPTPTTPAPTPPAPSPNQTASPPNTNDITQQTHLGYPRFQQAFNAIEHSINIPPGTFTGERLQQSAANLAYASLAGEERVGLNSRNESLSHIDFAVFNKDRDALIVGQGELGDPSAKLAWLPGAQDNGTPLTAASQRTYDLLQDPQRLALVNPALQQGMVQGGPEPEPAGPRR
jgi:hypothetical protein